MNSPSDTHGMAQLNVKVAVPVLADLALRIAALAYVNAEVFAWPVSIVPLLPGGKIPDGRITPNGHLDASDDPSQIIEWWTEDPAANIGLPLAANGLCAIDLDGAQGIATFRNLGPEYPVPLTCTVATGGGGAHLIYRIPDGRRPRGTVGVFDHVDLRGPGYVVAPQSVHPTGTIYRWVVGPWKLAPALAPEWILQPLTAPQPTPAMRTRRAVASDGANTAYGRCALRGIAAEMSTTAEGGRNHKLFAAACRVIRLIRAGHLAHGDLDVLRGAAATAGLSDSEIDRVLANAAVAETGVES